MPDFSGFGLFVTIPVFLAAAVVVWLAGTRLTRYANVISDKTGMGQALAGLLLLGAVTSLPEIAASVTSSLSGDATLAVNGILGGIAIQVTLLAVADALIGRRALTSVVPDSSVILQGALAILLLSLVAASVMVGDWPVLRVGLWMWLLLAVAGASFWVLSKVKDDQPWIANDPSGETSKEREGQRAKDEAEKEDMSLARALWQGAIAASLIIVAGYLLSRTADALAQQTGLGQSFAGAVLLAMATSLPEASTVTTAVRAGLYTMAISEIFGTNLFNVALLVLIDVTGGRDAVMNQVGTFSGFAALLGSMVIAITLVGLAERRDRTILRMGYDSAAVIVTYLGGLVVLYFLK